MDKKTSQNLAQVAEFCAINMGRNIIYLDRKTASEYSGFLDVYNYITLYYFKNSSIFTMCEIFDEI
jgi:hypothetical protein